MSCSVSTTCGQRYPMLNARSRIKSYTPCREGMARTNGWLEATWARAPSPREVRFEKCAARRVHRLSQS
jgi:hypothetical protein